MKKIKRLTARIYKYGPNKEYQTPYVLGKDIRKLHGKKWSEKFSKLYYGSTGMVISANDSSHGEKKDQFGIYEWDYSRFADQIDFGTPTYFD